MNTSKHGKESSEEFSRSREEKWSDWLQTIGTLATSAILIWLTVQQMYSNNQDQQNRVMADYVKQMTDLRIDHGLSHSFLKQEQTDPGKKEQQIQVKSAVRENTLNAARQLDGQRKGQLLKYLYDTELIGNCPPTAKNPQTSQIDTAQCGGGIINLSGIEFKEAVSSFGTDPLQRLSLEGIDLTGARLLKADLRKVGLIGADLSHADLRFARLDGADLEGAKMIRVKLHGAKLNDAKMKEARLLGANLKSANLSNADLAGADLRSANLSGAKLDKVNLEGAFYSNETNKETVISEEHKKVMRSCPSDLPSNAELNVLNEKCDQIPS